MTTESPSPAGLSDLIKSYKAQPEKTGNALAEKLMGLLTDPKVRNKIAAAAGAYAHQISIDLADLVEEVRQEAIAACLTKFRDAEFKVLSDLESSKYVWNAVNFAAQALVDRHLGSKRANGQGRSKGLSNSPFKWGTEDTDTAGYAAVVASEAEVDYSDPALSESDLSRYLDSIRYTDEKLHRCLTLYLEGYTQKEIAGIMGVDERTIRNYFKRAQQSFEG